MKNNLLKLVIASVSIFIAPIAAFSQDLGQGYSCVDAKIYKKKKEVALSKAKKAIQDKINNLGNSAKAKAKKKVLSDLKKALVACTQGSTPPGTTSDIRGSFSKYIVDYTVSSTLSETFYIRMDDDGTNINFNFSIGGDDHTFYGTDTFTISFVGTQTLPASATLATKYLGNVTFTVSKTDKLLNLKFENDAIPEGVRAPFSRYVKLIYNVTQLQSAGVPYTRFTGDLNCFDATGAQRLTNSYVDVVGR